MRLARLANVAAGKSPLGHDADQVSVVVNDGRQVEVLRYIARGLSKKEIASLMHVSVKTVEKHTDALMSKLNIHDRVELARYAIREGLAEA